MRFKEIFSEDFTATPAPEFVEEKANAPATKETVQAFADALKEKLGLNALNLWLQGTTLRLNMIWTQKQGTGLGTAAMTELCQYADDHGLRFVLTPNAKDDMFGTTSYARLVRFYKRFGFKENKGKIRDFSVSDAMIREPKSSLTEDQKVASAIEWDKRLPLVGEMVSGLRVRSHIDNLGSIPASFEDYFKLKGIREIPFSLFTGPDGRTHRIEALMADIEENGEITPLIVAIDSHNGPYILEGAHRYDALQYLDKPTFPALVVFDNDDGYFDTDGDISGLFESRLSAPMTAEDWRRQTDEDFAGIRIDELALPPDMKDAAAVLTNAGYEQQNANGSSGAFGSVWQKPGASYVLKIFSATDYAYEAFVNLAMQHQDNPHFPQFRGKMIRVTPKYLAVRMEPLTPYKANSLLLRRYTRYRNYMQAGGVDPNSIVAMEYEDCLEFLEEYPQLKDALDLLIDNLFDIYGNDMSDKNLLMRGKTIVITDPVAGTA